MLIRELILNKQKLIELCDNYNIKEQEHEHKKRMDMLDRQESYTDSDKPDRLFRNVRHPDQARQITNE